MNLLNWNCKGLGAFRAVREVTNLVNKFNPQVVFLMETKRKTNEMEWLRSKWKYDKCLTVKGIGRVGGLALLWMNEAFVEVISYSQNHIDVLIGEYEYGKRWKFTGFYEDPDTSKRFRSWDLLRYVKVSNVSPWLLSHPKSGCVTGQMQTYTYTSEALTY